MFILQKMCRSEALKNSNPMQLHYRNTLAGFLGSCASVLFWLIYWLAKSLIVVSIEVLYVYKLL